MNTSTQIEARIERLVDAYGDGADGTCPTREQWQNLFARPADEPVTFVNFFKLRDVPQYADSETERHENGQSAFDAYASVSIPAVADAGGEFRFVGQFEAGFIGDTGDWDIVAVGAFPTVEHFMALFENPDYIAAYVHRRAACERQQVSMCGN